MSRDDFYDSLFGRTYSAYMERPHLNRMIARVLWGGDTRPYYESMNAVGEVPAGGTIVDCPCGAGPAFRAIRPGSEVNYVAADLSPSMLRRARARVQKRGLPEIQFIEADATAIPVAASSADLFLSYWGLHCFPDPRAAIEEVARVLRPGGRLVGSCFVLGDSLRQRLQLKPHTTDFGPMCTEPELLEWLAEAGLRDVSASRSGLFMFFEATLGEADSDEPNEQQS
jgi:ubiquinone/menaquinone biosynthesis C-methylase UbiE